jgi:hypothetical protein
MAAHSNDNVDCALLGLAAIGSRHASARGASGRNVVIARIAGLGSTATTQTIGLVVQNPLGVFYCRQVAGAVILVAKGGVLGRSAHFAVNRHSGVVRIRERAAAIFVHSAATLDRVQASLLQRAGLTGGHAGPINAA